MNSLSLLTTHKTHSGGVHAQIKLNDKDIGVLYLSEREADILLSILRKGVINTDTRLQTDIIEEEEDWENSENDYV